MYVNSNGLDHWMDKGAVSSFFGRITLAWRSAT